MKAPRMRIRTIITLVAFAIASVISGSLYVLQLRFTNEISSSFEEETLELIKNLNSIFVFPVSIDDKKSVQAIASSVGRNKYIYSIEVRNMNGEVLASSINEHHRREKELAVIPYDIPIVDDRSIALSPFDESSNQEPVGTIRVLVTRSRTNKLLSTILLDSIVVLSSCIVIVLLLIGILGRSLSSNFKSTAAALKTIGSSKFTDTHNESYIIEFNMLNKRLSEIGMDVAGSIRDLKGSDNFKKNLISMVSHDLRTPVNTIAPLIDIMLDSVLDEDPDSIMVNHLEICRDSAALLRSVMDQLLDFREMDKMELRIVESKFTAEAVFDTIYNVYRKKVSEHVVLNMIADINSSSDIDSSQIVSDESKLIRILTNILENSIKFTEQGSITIRWYLKSNTDGDYLCFSVEDTGTGIEQNCLPYIFDEFYRSDTNVPGWGVGLSIVKQFVDTMGGSIHVDSAISIGTTVRVELPVFLEKREVILDSQMFDINVYIVDDNINNCYVMKHVLESMGISSTSYINPKQALEEIDDSKCDLIFVDFSMPEMNGVEFAKETRERGINVPIVCVTAHVEKEVLDQINFSIENDEGITHMLRKPIDKYIVQSVVQSIMATRVIVNEAIDKISKS